MKNLMHRQPPRYFSLVTSNLSSRALGVMLLTLGLMVVTAGIWITSVGGSSYHLLAGAGAVICGSIMIRSRRLGLIAYALVLFFSCLWVIATYESDISRFLLRLMIPNVLMIGLPLLVALLVERHFGNNS